MIIIIIIFANGEAWEIKIASIFSRGTPVVLVFPFFWGSSTHKRVRKERRNSAKRMPQDMRKYSPN